VSRRLAWLALGGLLAPVAGLRAQAMWNAQLAISAYPSPYLSDWEANPSIGTLTISNPTASDQNVLLTYRLTNQNGQVLASGRSDPVLIPSGPPTVITDFVNMSGSSQHDQALEDQMRRTGRLPEGDNTTCVAVTDAGGFVLAEDCATFSIVYPDPPYLIGPLDEAALTTGNPIFQWTPLQVPPSFHLSYVVRVSEILAGQSAEQALAANIPVFETASNSTTLEYPVTAQPLTEGKSYAWRVQALDQNGYAASANAGRSDIWTFAPAGTGGGGAGRESGAMRLEVFNTRTNTSAPSTVDTLGLTGICKDWDQNISQVPQISLGFNSPIGFPDFLSVQGQLVRHTNPTTLSRTWALTGTWRNKYSVMLYGDCDGWAGHVPWPQWVGIRTIAGAATVEWLVTADKADDGTVTLDSALADTSTARGLEFGIVVFTLRTMTVKAPTGFREVQEFLADNEIDVKPGINAFGIVQLQQRAMWPWFQSLGYDQREIALQGYAGLNNAWSVGFGASSEGGPQADVSLTTEFLNLTAALPERTPPGAMGQLFSRSHVEFELKLQDTTAIAAQRQAPTPAGEIPPERQTGLRNQSVQFDLILSLKWVLELSDDAINAMSGSRLRLHGDSAVDPALVLSVGIDLGRAGSVNSGLSATEAKLVLKGEMEGYWAYRELRVGHPQIEFDYTLNGKNKGTFTFAVTGAVGLGDELELGVLGFTLGRKTETGAVTPEMTTLRMYWERTVSRMQMNLSGVVAQQERGRATDAQVQAARDALAIALREQAKAAEMAADLERMQQSPATATATGATPAPSTPATPATPATATKSEFAWAVRFSLGNMSLMRALALMTGRDP